MLFVLMTVQRYGGFLLIPRKFLNSSLTCSDNRPYMRQIRQMPSKSDVYRDNNVMISEVGGTGSQRGVPERTHLGFVFERIMMERKFDGSDYDVAHICDMVMGFIGQSRVSIENLKRVCLKE